MKFEVHLLVYLMIELSSGEIASTRHAQTPCDHGGSALVERFFNLIFAEFHSTPPICTCVQMCKDQPTYCYPNGCFKKAERKKEPSPVSSIQHDENTMFLVDSEKDVLVDFIEHGNLMAPMSGYSEKKYQRMAESQLNDHNNHFKEIVFKYKRIPKLQMKYNLREHVKHTREKKSEVDVSKTRWPINKQINHQKISNYLASIFPETNQLETPKYFKRYLTKRENQIGLDISELYLYKDASNFSLETLIDNLIERGLEANSTLELKISNSTKLKHEDDEVDNEDTNEDTKLINSVIEYLNNNTDTIDMKILKTNATEDNNSNHIKYKNESDYENTTTAKYFEMMKTLSKEIDKQNHISVEHLTGNRSGPDSENILRNISINHIDHYLRTTLSNYNLSHEVGESTTNTIPSSLHQVSIPIVNSQGKKSKQRIARRLRNRKRN